MDALAKKYPQVQWVFIYCHEAHAEMAPDATAARPTPRGDNAAERQRSARRLRDDVHVQRRIFPDGFGEACVFDRYFSDPIDNPLVVVDVDGKIACTLSWTDAEQVDAFLARLLAQAGKWSPALLPPRNSSPDFKAMIDRLQKARQKGH
jgi:hypothetical protein